MKLGSRNYELGSRRFEVGHRRGTARHEGRFESRVTKSRVIKINGKIKQKADSRKLMAKKYYICEPFKIKTKQSIIKAIFVL